MQDPSRALPATPSDAPWTLAEPIPATMTEAVTAVEARPGDAEVWGALEELADQEQRPDVVEGLYVQQLEAMKGAPEEVEELGQRALRFHDEWSDDGKALERILRAVLRRDVGASWAFERLTMALTMGERWTELLGLYDQALAATTDLGRRREMLDEAAHVAKDFAGQPDRAIDYLWQLAQLRPTDGALASSLERLLDGHKRYRELVKLWELRAGVLEGEAARALRLRTALCWLDQVHDAMEAVQALEPLLAEGYEEARVVATLERVAATASVPDEARARAYARLEVTFAQRGDEREVLRVLEGSLDVATTTEERARIHRRASALHEHLGDERAALDHLSHLVPLAPSDESALAALRRLGERVGSPGIVAHALAGAADALGADPRAVELREEAAEMLSEKVGDADGAAQLRHLIFGSSEASTAQVRRAGERLWRDPGPRANRESLLPVLERLAELGPAEGEAAPGLWRHDLLGDLAEMAQVLGQPERSLRAWELRLTADPADREALDGRIDALEQLHDWEPLQRALQERADSATDEEARRRDLVRIAKVVAATASDTARAIEAWRGVEATFGREDDTVDALAELYARASRPDDLQQLLTEAEAQAPAGSRRAVLRASLAALAPTALGALELLQSALVDDPSCERARQGLRERLDDREVGALALASLVDACDRADDWRERLELLELRLKAASDDEARATILVEAATDHETRANDPSVALTLLGRALTFHPDAIAIEQNLLRLGEQTGNWPETVTSLSRARDASAALDARRTAVGRTQELRTRVGDLLEHRLADLPGALEAHREVLADEPAFPGTIEAVARLGARLERHGDVARALREAATRGEIPSALVATVESHVQAPAGWTSLMAALETEVNDEGASTDARHRLAHRLGLWLRDQLGDRDLAEAALQTAIDLDPTDERSLLDLAELQRDRPSPSLVSTLRWLSDARGGDEVALREASELALDRFGDADTGASLLEELLAVAQRHWQGNEEIRSSEPPRWYAAWAIERLVSLREHQGEVGQAIQILETGAGLSFSESETLALLHRAALLAHRGLGDQTRAAGLYRRILELEPNDIGALGSLAEIYQATDQRAELLAVRQRELAIGAALERRLDLRLDVARVAALLGDEAQRVAALRSNLEDRPGHPASVAEITRALMSAQQPRALLELLRQQADTLEHLGEPTGARTLWLQAAELAEGPLADASAAIAALGRAVALAETADVLDSLGRLHRMRGEPAHAVRWYERRLGLAGDEAERAEVVLRLAASLADAGRHVEARTHLEAALAATPGNRAVHNQLASLYRATEAWAELVTLLLEAAEREAQVPARLALYVEAAEVLQRHVHDATRAVELLERAVELAPGDRGVRAGLADAMRASGQLDAAQRILEELLAEFGRRRPPERATVHYQLAQLAQARGDMAEALTQLDTASGIDTAHGGALLLLGQLARQNGQLERAERAFRALLLTLRRQRSDSAGAHPVGLSVSEVTLELYRLAQQLEQSDRAAELLESVFAAAQAPAEAARLERALRDAGETELLQRALVARVERAGDSAEKVAALVDLARAQTELSHEAEAFDALTQALSLSPDDESAHDAARRLARRGTLGTRYVDHLRALAAASPAPAAAALWLRLGAFHEADENDLPSALAAYEQPLALEVRQIDAHRAIERIAAALGDDERRLSSLRAQVDLLTEDPEPTELASALYRLAAVELSNMMTIEAGVATLSRAFELAPRPAEALALARSAAVRPRDLLLVHERIAREARDEAALLDALEGLASLSDVDDAVLREAAALAERRGDHARTDALLRTAADSTGASWAALALGERHRAAGDLRTAHRWLARAADATEGDEAFAIGLDAARVAAELGDSALAIQSYQRLFTARPGERRVWEPLLVLLRKADDAEAVDAVLASAALATDDPASRRWLRFERAEALRDDAFRQDDAVAVLQAMLADDPNDVDAQALLLNLYEQTGRGNELTALLQQQFASALERRSLDEVSSLAQRLGSLLGQRRDEALAVYRQARTLLPDEPVLLRAHLARLGSEGDPAERAELLDALLRDGAAPDAARLAQQLGEARAALGEPTAVEAALRRGLELAPDDDGLHRALETFFTSHERWRALVDWRVAEATQQLDSTLAAARLVAAAQVLSQQLRLPSEAVGLLRRARELASDDLGILRALVDALLDAGEGERANAEVTAALERTYVDNATRGQLLRLGALLARRQGREAEAVASLEQALALGATDATGDLLEALEQQRQVAARQGDAGTERAATLRLADLHLQPGGSTEQGLDLLRQWIGRQPSDLEALHKLLALETAAEHWGPVIELCHQLIAADESEGRADAALRLLEACTRAGDPSAARTGLEQAFASYPKHVGVRTALRQLYEQLGAAREQADVLLYEAADMADDDPGRFVPYRRAAELYLQAEQPASAIPVLEAAAHLRPGDHDVTLMLVDAYIAQGQLEQATAMLDAAIAGHKNKRSPQLSVLQHRMARVALAAGDRSIEVQWLNAALDTDAQNGQAAAELADAATEIGQLDLALKALRAITVAKNPGVMSKGMAFYRQGLINYHQGDQRKAVVMAKRGLQEDPSLAEARTFLEQLGEKV